MGKLERLMNKLSIPVPRPRIRLPRQPEPGYEQPRRLGAADAACALGALAGRNFSSPKNALSWARKKKLLPPKVSEQMSLPEACHMLFAFARACRVNIALPSRARIFDITPVEQLPQWSLPGLQWCLSAGLLPPGDVTGAVSGDTFSRMLEDFCRSAAQAQTDWQRQYKLQLFGDSITDDRWGDCTTWVSFFPHRLAGAQVLLVNNAYGGGVLTASPVKKNSVAKLLPRMLHQDNDLVVVFAGTNDFASSCYGVGEPGSRDAKTHWGAIREICAAVAQIPVMYVSSPPRYNLEDRSRSRNDQGQLVNCQGWTLEQGTQAIQKAAEHFGCAYLDMYFDPVFTKEELPYATIDGLHPNLVGDILIAARIYGKVSTLLAGGENGTETKP